MRLVFESILIIIIVVLSTKIYLGEYFGCPKLSLNQDVVKGCLDYDPDCGNYKQIFVLNDRKDLVCRIPIKQSYTSTSDIGIKYGVECLIIDKVSHTSKYDSPDGDY